MILGKINNDGKLLRGGFNPLLNKLILISFWGAGM